MKICVVMPTRGIFLADTIRSTFLNEELPKDTIFKIIMNHPLPECHNIAVLEALKTDCTHILFVENDISIPKYGILNMIMKAESGSRYVAIDYGMVIGTRPDRNTTIMIDMGKVKWTGFGCTMFDRTIFEKEFKYPFFTDRYQYRIISKNPLNLYKENKAGKYGYYDIHFGLECEQKGIQITKLEGFRCKHLRLTDFEQFRVQNNNGLYRITEIT